MSRFLTLILSAAILVAPASGAFAQSAKPEHCQQGVPCKQQPVTPDAKKVPETSKPAKTTTSAAKVSPRIGDSAKDKQRYTPSKSSKLGNAPNGQEYRVVNDRVVLVNSSTMKIVKVIGALSDLPK